MAQPPAALPRVALGGNKYSFPCGISRSPKFQRQANDFGLSARVTLLAACFACSRRVHARGSQFRYLRLSCTHLAPFIGLPHGTRDGVASFLVTGFVRVAAFVVRQLER